MPFLIMQLMIYCQENEKPVSRDNIIYMMMLCRSKLRLLSRWWYLAMQRTCHKGIRKRFGIADTLKIDFWIQISQNNTNPRVLSPLNHPSKIMHFSGRSIVVPCSRRCATGYQKLLNEHWLNEMSAILKMANLNIHYRTKIFFLILTVLGFGYKCKYAIIGSGNFWQCTGNAQAISHYINYWGTSSPTHLWITRLQRAIHSYRKWRNNSISHILICISFISHHACFATGTAHMYPFMLQNGALWDMDWCIAGVVEKVYYNYRLYMLYM